MAFVGRVAELAALEEALASAIVGRGAAVVLRGEPGIGKTRIASELCDRAERRGARTVWARAAADAPSYWPFAQVVRQLYGREADDELAARFGPGGLDAARLARGGDDDERSSPPAEQRRFRLFDALAAMIVEAARLAPLVIVFDDIHDADPDCLRLLVFVARALRSSRVLLVATCREAEAARPELAAILLGDLARATTTVRVAGWDVEEITAFLAQRGEGVPSAAAVAALHRASGGNPFFVSEIARLAGTAGELTVPRFVREVVVERLSRLETRVVAAVEVAATVGFEFETREVAGATDPAETPGVASGDLLALAEEAGFLERRKSDGWAFRHDIVREAIYEATNADRRRRLHLGAWNCGLGRLTDSEVRAHHALGAMPLVDAAQVTAAVLAAAARARQSFAYERAASWLARATELLRAGGRDADLGAILVELGDALWSDGKFDASRRAYEEAAELAERIDDAELLARAALGFGGRQQRAHVQYDADVVAWLERALARLQASGEAAAASHAVLRARLLARLAYALYSAPASRPTRERVSEEALRLIAGVASDPTVEVASAFEEERSAVLADCRWALWGPADLQARRRIGDELLRRAQRRGDREGMLVEQGWRIVDFLELGERGAMDEAFAIYRGGASALRLPWFAWYAARFACLFAQVEGRLDEAERLAADALVAGERAGHPDAPLAFASQMFGIRLMGERLVETEAALEATVARYPDVALWRRLLARLRLAEGRSDEAAGELERVRNGALVDAEGDYHHLPSLVLLAELAVAAGDERLRRRVLDALLPFSGRNVVLGFGMAFLGSTDAYLAELALALGATALARRHAETALASARRLGSPTTRARLVLASAAGGDGAAGDAGAERGGGTAARSGGGAVERSGGGAAKRSGGGAAKRSGGGAAGGDAGTRGGAGGDGAAGDAGAERGSGPEASDAAGAFGENGRTAAPASWVLRGASRPEDAAMATFVHEAAAWMVTFEGRRFRLAHLRGFVYLRALLEEPDREFHVIDLVGLPDPGRSRSAKPPSGDRRASPGVTTRLDQRQRAEYRQHLAELSEELEEAERFADAGRATIVRVRIERLRDELARTLAPEVAGGEAERARVAVAKRIRAALERLGEHSPELRRYFEATIKTGVFCVYRPDPGRPVAWRL